VQPAITEYDLNLAVFKFYHSKTYKREHITIRKTSSLFPSKNTYARIKKNLEEYGIIKSQDKYYTILGQKNTDPEDIICSIDPFVYISHISAMSFHGLTDRIPSSLYVSGPDSRKWRIFAKEKMKKDYEDVYEEFLSSGLAKLTMPRLDKIGKYPVEMYSSLHTGAFKHVMGRVLRVSTIGRTFLDMLREPSRCGGIRHVKEIFSTFGVEYKNLIIDELNQHGNKIEKVRAGYLFEEVCDIRDVRIDQWVESCVERGGSRKLDPTAEYSSIFSERWCLSLNLD